MTNTEKHPLDFDVLQKGTWIETPRLERAVMCKRDNPHFGLKLIGLAQQIELETGILCRIDHLRIRLMEDNEASEHAQRRTEQCVRGLRRQAWRLTQVDPDKLSDPQRAAHQHRLLSTSSIATAARQEFRKAQRMVMLLGKGED